MLAAGKKAAGEMAAGEMAEPAGKCPFVFSFGRFVLPASLLSFLFLIVAHAFCLGRRGGRRGAGN